MNIVARVVLFKLADFTGTNLTFPFELPLGMDPEEADDYIKREQPIHGRRLQLDPPTEAWALGMSEETEGELVRMVRTEWDWVVMPHHVLRIEPWTSHRIGRWAPDDAEEDAPAAPVWSAPVVVDKPVVVDVPDVPEAPEPLRLPIQPRLAPGGPVVLAARANATLPTVDGDEAPPHIFRIQLFALRGPHNNGRPRRGHDRFQFIFFAPDDVTIGDPNLLAALLEAQVRISGWRVSVCPGSVEGLCEAEYAARRTMRHELAYDDVRMIMPLWRSIHLLPMETTADDVRS